MDDWRKVNLSWDEKMQYVFDNNYLTDLTVKVSDGKATRSFNAHKLILSMSSDVLEEELRAECLRVPGEAVLNITAANPIAFEQFLRFIYCKDIHLKSIREASDVIKVSIKFNVAELTKICLEYVERNLNYHTYMECAEFARMYNLKYLKSRCSELVRKNTKLIMNEDNIANWNMEAIIDVLEQPHLQLREIELFYLVEKWIKSKNLNDLSFRNKVREYIMPKFCFMSMTAEEFTTGPLSSGLLEKNESLAVLGHIVADRCDVPYPEGFNQNIREIYSEPKKSLSENKGRSSISELEEDFIKPIRTLSSITTKSALGMAKKEPQVQFVTGCKAVKKEKEEDKVKNVAKTNISPKSSNQTQKRTSVTKSIIKSVSKHSSLPTDDKLIASPPRTTTSRTEKVGAQKTSKGSTNSNPSADLATLEKLLQPVLAKGAKGKQALTVTKK
ncbi:BTB/POZ domain-containing protein 2-like [Cimex lectularius]|uniref:BTB domain-containing protein n=1 Tax=Cimex lectularius TaxID=79782 RepID=A0A8I6RY06_CIMLE|nr:BTB/POZ domain-containing protein 2-like [Cimex lectularius]